MPTARRLSCALILSCLATLVASPAARADNSRLNDAVATNVYTIQHQAGCTTDVHVNPQLRLAAQWHTNDVLTNHALDGDTGSDGSTPQDRANAAGFRGTTAETVAINPALAINGIEILHQWYYRPDYFAIMADCAYTEIGVWSENSLDRSVVVAVYGNPADSPPAQTTRSRPLHPLALRAGPRGSQVPPVGSRALRGQTGMRDLAP